MKRVKLSHGKEYRDEPVVLTQYTVFYQIEKNAI